MKIVAFGASYSKNSINKKLAIYAASFFKKSEIEILDLNDYLLPLFTVDVEKEIGVPQAVKNFIAKLDEADLLIISLAEHNGSYTAAFKNLFDWTSRFKMKMFEGKKMLLLSTSPGPRGGLSALEAAMSRFPRHGAEIIGYFSLPKFDENFSAEEGISNTAIKQEFDYFISTALQNMKYENYAGI
ncbi:MAG: NAD(P)H-dependent oxidoreductase [Chitinophaga sp.]|uniref:NADPH-dependent FMN reductase n=1 Tax=Chitinophaga sp. TaxID=1869181 RepID=UPI0025C54571|nr:NAD(P)H-dependent oxidoreductase [Chitinophaga sp.]MBV8251422.1 NAD(P)H-dependent oxidoreductase [Chitinophaga sp.]